ncbi:MAG: hypothetical protein V1891_04700 [bacterium]
MARGMIIIFVFLLLVTQPFNLLASNDENIIKEIEEYAPKLKIEYVIQTVREYLNKHNQGYKAEEYFIQSVKYDSSKKEWIVSFEEKIPMPGSQFWIAINDGTKEIQLFVGE